MLDVTQDHRTVLLTKCQPSLPAQHSVLTVCRGELAWDRDRAESPLAAPPRVRQTANGGDWHVEIAYPFAAFPELARRTSVGINLHLSVVAPDGYAEWALASDGQYAESPWRFPSLYLIESPLRICELTIESLSYDAHRFRALVENRSDETISGTLRAAVQGEQRHWQQDVPFRLPGRARRSLRGAFNPDPRQVRRQVLSFELCDGMRTVWSGSYHMGNGISIEQIGHVLHLRHRYPLRPWPHDANLSSAKRLDILSRLPRFRRQPAPYLFTERLVDERGRFCVDLRRRDALRRIARYLVGKFPKETDLLAALTYFVNQNLAYSGVCSRAASHMDSLGKFRVGGEICSGFSMVLKALLDELLNPRTGRPYRSEYQNTGNRHVVLAVFLGRRKVFLDPTFGVVHFDATARRLLSAHELAANPRLIERTILGRNEDYTQPERSYMLPSGRGIRPR